MDSSALSFLIPLMFILLLETIVPLVATFPFTQKFPALTVIAPSSFEAANSVYGYDSALSSELAETIGTALIAIIVLRTPESKRLKIGFMTVLLKCFYLISYKNQ